MYASTAFVGVPSQKTKKKEAIHLLSFPGQSILQTRCFCRLFLSADGYYWLCVFVDDEQQLHFYFWLGGGSVAVKYLENKKF